MKHCISCQEDFSDKFSFCPVCGTPLNATKPEPVSVQNFSGESINSPSSIKPTVAASDFLASETSNITEASDKSFVADKFISGNGSTFTEAETVETKNAESVDANVYSENNEDASDSLIRKDEDYHLTFLDDKGLGSRLFEEGASLARDFAKDPVGFTKSSFNAIGQALQQLKTNKSAMAAIGLAFIAMIALVGVAYSLDRTKSTSTSKAGIVLFSVAAAILLLGIFASWISRDKNNLQYGVGGSRQVVSESGSPWFLATGILVVLGIPILAFGLWVLLTLLGIVHPRNDIAANQDQEITIIDPTEIPEEQKKVDKGAAGTDKGKGGGSKPKQEKPGGGGGQDNQKPASQGKPPQASLTVPPIIPPLVDPPRVKNPSLPVPATVVADPTLFPPDPKADYGDPNSKSKDKSMGDGKGGGIGGGDGGGVGPGNGGNTGGGDRNDGGGGPGGGGGGDTDYTKIFNPKEVTQKAVITSKPTPEYTEEARKNQVQGVVRIQAILNANGSVTGVRAISGLPNGLTEKAIAATRRVQFTPAKKDGRAVSQYVTLEYNFKIY